MKNINDRLIAAWKSAELSIADMGVWFDTQRRTMETWLHGVRPHPCRHSQIEERLDLLEKAIASRKHFPVPINVTQYQRKSYILQVRDVVSSSLARRVSKTRSSK